ncbi:MAG: DUF6498-containing protein [Pseudomonadota bacterium]
MASDPPPTAGATTDDAVTQPTVFSAAVLVAVNLLPLLGVFLADWDVFQLLALFWAENVVIGALGIVRLLKVERRLSTPLFFVAHFGGFCTAHAVLLVSLFGPGQQGPDVVGALQLLTATLGATGALLSLAALATSHLWSLAANFIGQREYQRIGVREAMRLPYQRIMMTQVALIGGAALIARFDEPLLGLVLLVAIKTLSDLRAHWREHASLRRGTAPRGL